MSGIAAVDLYENKLRETDKALEVLVELHQSGLSTLPVRERLARAAAKTSVAGRHATQILEELMKERPTSEGRIEAARLAMAIWRDKLTAAARAPTRGREAARGGSRGRRSARPGARHQVHNMLARELLSRGRDALVASLEDSPARLRAHCAALENRQGDRRSCRSGRPRSVR